MFCDDLEEELIGLPKLKLGVVWKKFSTEKKQGNDISENGNNISKSLEALKKHTLWLRRERQAIRV